ncbi:MAG: hypothetical protein Q9191_001184 [Dirinaria sp. TL-2023a]
MVAATRLSAAASAPQAYVSPPRQRFATSEKQRSTTTASDEEDNMVYAEAEELKRARVDHSRRDLGHRREGIPKQMASHGGKRRDPNSTTSSVRDAKVTVCEVRREKVPCHRDSRRENRHRDRDNNEVVYVYKYVDGPKAQKEAPRPHQLRRTSEQVSRTRLDPPRSDKRRLSVVDQAGEETRRRRVHSRARDHDEVSRAQKRRQSVSSARESFPVARSASARERPSAPPPPPPLQRSKTSSRETRRAPPHSIPGPPLDRTASVRRKPERAGSIFGSIFGQSKPSEPPAPEKVVECLTCLSDVPVSKTAKLACTHRMCHACLRRIFTLSITDPQHMPPKCCTSDHIPLKHVDKLFDIRFKMKWNQKYQEYTTKNRIYCPARGCGEWIKPANIHIDTSGGANGGRKYGRCGRCRTKVCCTCNGRWHSRRECPKDEATARFAEIAKKEGWQRCFNCSATVELKEGCNHMTCRCRAEFCMICGAKWKTCDCPWFNYEAVENDRLHHLQIPQPVPRRMPGNPALGYQEELDRRREQERADEALARRIQALGLDETDRHPPRQVNVHEYLVHPQPPPLPPELVRRAQDLLTGDFGNAQAEINRIFAPRPSQQEPLPRSNFAAPRAHHDNPAMRASERAVPRAFGAEDQNQRPRHAHEQRAGEIRSSTLAGLSRATTEGRVDAWRRHVEV